MPNIPQAVLKRFRSGLAVTTILAQLFFIGGYAIPLAKADTTPTLTTDKADYHPEETVVVSGSGFDAFSSIQMKVTRPNGTVVTGDGSFAAWPTDYDTVAVTNGSLTYNYVLDGVAGTYTVEALNPADSSVVSTVTFTDASIGTYDQCSNDLGDGYTSGDLGCRWINGNLNSNNSLYHEGDSTVQRTWLTGFTPGTSHTITFQYGTTKGGKHAYDFLTTWNQSENWVTDADRCQDITGCTSVSDGTFAIPNDPNVTDTIEGLISPRNMTIRGGTITAISTPTIVSGSYAGDSETAITVTFTVPASGAMCATKSGSTTCAAALWFGAHVARSDQWTAFNNTTGATTISGSPYHVALAAIDGTAIGQRDNQMQSGTIVIVDNPSVATEIHNAAHTVVTSVPIGSTVHDRAVVTNGGPNGTPAGTATFSWFTNGTCTGPATAISSAQTLSSGSVDATGFAQGPLGTGSYSFKAHYTSSDATKWNNADGPCEPLTVGQGTSAVTTTLHKADHSIVTVGSSVPLGTIMHDSATVTPSSSFAPTGNVDFRFYTSLSTCTADTSFTGGTTMGSIALNGANPGVAHPSTSTAALTPGTYAFKAKWAGDTNYTGNTSACENFTVNQSTSGISTTLHTANHSVVSVGGHVDLGTIMHDSATVTPNGSIAPSGSVSFMFFASYDCSGQGTTMGTVALDGANPGVAHPSTSTSALGAGDYSFQATWAGDANYTGNVSSCENFTVDQAQLTVDTHVHDANHSDITNGAVAVGSVVHDAAITSGGVSGFTVPATIFTFYTNNTCTGTGSSVANTGADEGDASAVRSAASGALTAGQYSYKGSVVGDTNYLGDNSDCEPFSTIDAKISVSPLTATNEVNQAHTITATVQQDSGAGFVNAPDGTTVTFSLLNNTANAAFVGGVNTCTTTAGSCSVSINTSTTGSVDIQATTTFSVNSVSVTRTTGDGLSGDSANAHKTYVDAQITISPLTATNKINDPHTITATVKQDAGDGAGWVNAPDGTTVTFSLLNNNNGAAFVGGIDTCTTTAGTCSVSINASSTGTVDIHATTTFSVGGVSMTRATGDGLSGDSANASKEYVNARISITPASDTNPVNAPHTMTVTVEQDTGSGFVPVVGATVNTLTSPAPSSVNNADCLDGTNASGQCDVIINSTTPGTFTTYARSTIVVDGVTFKLQTNGLGDNSGPAVKTYLDDMVTTVIHKAGDESTNYDLNANPNGGNLPLGSSVHDNATVTPSSGSISGGTVTYTMYASNDCSGTVAATETVALGVESQNSPALATGDYSYLAHFSGSGDYPAHDAACERIHIVKGTTTTATELHENATHAVIAEGGESTTGNVHDKATVTGDTNGFTPTGSVVFRFYTSPQACVQDEGFIGGTTKGTVTLDGSGVAHPSDATGSLAAGSYAFRAHYLGDGNYNESISGCENFTVSTLTINKLANGGNDTFGFTVTGPTGSTPSITTSGTPGTGTVTQVVTHGSYTVGETTLPTGWQFVGLNCAGVAGTNPTSAAFNIPAGTNQVCNFENTKNGATRTQGFWATHTAFTNAQWANVVAAGQNVLCGTKTITATTGTGTNILMGGFWSNVAKTSTGIKRSNLDQARMVLLQQLEAALLNKYALGTDDGGLIAAAKTAYCGTNLNAIKQATGALDTFNQSGDSVPTGFPSQAATTQVSKSQANIPYWNSTI